MKDVGEKFNRKINYSPLQNIFMDGANKVHGGSMGTSWYAALWRTKSLSCAWLCQTIKQ